jgi:ferredoxin
VQDGSYAIACHRIASGVGADVVVHCLGSLSPSAWLSLLGEVWPRAVEIFDAGACATCAAGGVAAPWTEPLGRATRTMACAGLSFARAPRVVPVTADEDDEAPDPVRRRLLGLFALDSTKVTVIDPPTKRPSAKTDATEIGRQAAALLELVAAGEPESNVTAMPAAVVTPACNVCGACAAICPTPALTISECGDGERRLSFEGRQCVHCLACQSVCPTGALAVCEFGGTGESTVVRSLPLTVCAACGHDFAAGVGQSLCQVCQRSAELGADAALRSWSPGGARSLLSAFSTRE